MKLDVKALTLAVVLVTAVGYLLCAGIIALAPHSSMVLLSTMTHTKPGSMSWSLSWGGAAAGLVLTTAVAALGAWLVAAFYNFLIEASARHTERESFSRAASKRPAASKPL